MLFKKMFDLNISKEIESSKKVFLDNLYKNPSIHSVWMNLDIYKIDRNLLTNRFKDADLIVVVGTGGSYIGIHAAVDFLSCDKDRIVFLGGNLDAEYIQEQLNSLRNKKVVINAISNSGETLETLICLKLVLDFVRQNSIEHQVIVSTSNENGKLYQLALENKFEVIKIPENLVGRYSTLFVAIPTLCFFNVDIDEMLLGAKDGFDDESVFEYASLRNYFYNKGIHLEILQFFEYYLMNFAEWWKQLFAESEGKNNKGLFPVSLFFTRDLHSIGQYLQDGKKHFFQTTLFFDEGKDVIYENKSVRSLNRKIADSIQEAHNTYNIEINLKKRDAYSFGYLLFFFQKACVISSYILGVNSYDNEGVLLYKSNLKNKIT